MASAILFNTLKSKSIAQKVQKKFRGLKIASISE